MVRIKQLEEEIKQSLGGYYGSTLCPRPTSLSQTIVSTRDLNLKSLAMKPKLNNEGKILINAESHRISESHRRSRIIHQFNMLRCVLPNLIKRDKASVLKEALKQVKDFKKRTEEVKAVHNDSLEQVLPSESEELSLGYSEKDKSLLKATISCYERPKLMSLIQQEVRKVNGTIVKAEMVFVGGRIKSILWVKGFRGKERFWTLERALKTAIEQPKNRKGKHCLMF